MIGLFELGAGLHWIWMELNSFEFLFKDISEPDEPVSFGLVPLFDLILIDFEWIVLMTI